jgi:hypothetical protein
MTLADVLAVLAGLAIAGGGFASLSLILSLLAPGAVDRAAERVARRPGRSLGLGLLMLLAVLVFAGSVLKVPSPLARLAGLAAVLFGLSLAVLGGAGMAATLAKRLRGPSAGALGVREMLRGVFVLESAVLLPILGWLVVLPSAFLISLGAGLHALLRRGSPAAVTAPAAQG